MHEEFAVPVDLPARNNKKRDLICESGPDVYILHLQPTVGKGDRPPYTFNVQKVNKIRPGAYTSNISEPPNTRPALVVALWPLSLGGEWGKNEYWLGAHFAGQLKKLYKCMMGSNPGAGVEVPAGRHTHGIAGRDGRYGGSNLLKYVCDE